MGYPSLFYGPYVDSIKQVMKTKFKFDVVKEDIVPSNNTLQSILEFI